MDSEALSLQQSYTDASQGEYLKDSECKLIDNTAVLAY